MLMCRLNSKSSGALQVGGKELVGGDSLKPYMKDLQTQAAREI
jgi:hypothetical protein